MTVKVGYLLPTREKIMAGSPETRSLIDGARRAHDLGFDSIWIGDSLLARPRHDPLTLLAAVAAAVPDVELGPAVLLPALRNPVVLAQQVATIDQISEGRLILGIGIAGDNPPIRAEFAAAGVPFEGRVGRMMEGFDLSKALWTGDPVSWQGRWELTDSVLAPTPHRPGGPPIWLAAGVDVGIERAAQHYDGWFPIGPDVETFGHRQQTFVEAAIRAGRDPADLTTAIYLTVAIDDDAEAAEASIDSYLASYYGAPPAVLRSFQACRGGSVSQVLEFIRSYVDAGAQHVVLRFVGDHGAMLTELAAHRSELDS
ncbi:MAG: LLM class flavin-dependent oxidoreductase [Acidimicrobiales bacterium]|jgi:alkanesulfonate monooxygenase SsuD/methylene tetrahydromethanopterin reductase-like flavin-dependent oxidoreductase (luciferase family)